MLNANRKRKQNREKILLTHLLWETCFVLQYIKRSVSVKLLFLWVRKRQWACTVTNNHRYLNRTWQTVAGYNDQYADLCKTPIFDFLRFSFYIYIFYFSWFFLVFYFCTKVKGNCCKFVKHSSPSSQIFTVSGCLSCRILPSRNSRKLLGGGGGLQRLSSYAHFNFFSYILNVTWTANTNVSSSFFFYPTSVKLYAEQKRILMFTL